MEALEAILRPVARLLNRNIRETTPALKLCRELDGAVIAVRVRDTGIAAFFIVDDDHIDVVADTDAEPDLVIDGTLLTLARMLGQSGESAIRNGSLELTGEARLAQRFQRLLSLARPDLEEELSSVVGDVAAHRIGALARGVGRWGKAASETMSANIREYLQEETGNVPSRYEVDRFTEELGTLRDDVDRAEARLERLLGER